MQNSDYYPNLDVGYIFSKSWGVFKDNMGFVLGVLVVQILIVMVSAVIPILPLLISGPLQAGIYLLLVRLVRDEDVALQDMFEGFKEFGRTLGVYWLYSLVVMVGLILLVVPGVVLAIGLMPAMFLVLDANYGVSDTLQESWEMTRGHKMSLLVLYLAIMGVVILGVLVFVVGAVFAIAFSYVVIATAYDELAQAHLGDVQGH
jgi:uncharacterized membrane protein